MTKPDEKSENAPPARVDDQAPNTEKQRAKKPLVPLAMYLGETKVWWPGISDDESNRLVGEALKDRGLVKSPSDSSPSAPGADEPKKPTGNG